MASIKPLKVQVIADTKRFNTGMKNASRGVRKFTSDSKKHLGGLKNTMSGLTGKLPMLAGFLGTAALIKAGKDVMDYKDKLTRFRIETEISANELSVFESKINTVSAAVSQSQNDILDAALAMKRQGVEYEFITKSLETIGGVATAAGTDMSQVASVAAQLHQSLDIPADKLMNVFDIIISQSKKGKFSLKEMADVMPLMIRSLSGLGLSGEEGIRQFSAMFNIIARGYKSTTFAARAYEGVLDNIRRMGEDEAVKVMELTGFSIIDIEKSKDNGRMILKNHDIILKTLIKNTGGDLAKLSQIFNAADLKALKPLIASFKKFGDTFEELESIEKLGGTGEQAMKDFNLAAATAKAQFGSIVDQLSEFSNLVFDKPIIELNKALTELNEMQFFSNIGMIIGKLTETQALDIAAPFRLLNEVIEPIAANIESIISVLQFTSKVAKVPFEILSTIVTHTPQALLLKSILGDEEGEGIEKTTQKKPSTTGIGFKSRQAIEDAIFLGSGNSLKTIQNSASTNSITNNVINDRTTAANKEPGIKIDINIVDGVASVKADNARVSLKTTSTIKRIPFFGGRQIGQ